MKVFVFARSPAKLVAPPTVRHHTETASAMIADFGLPHDTLAKSVNGVSLRWQPAAQKKAMKNFSPTIASTVDPFPRAKEF